LIFPSFHTRRNKKRCCTKCSTASLVLAHLFDHRAAGGIILIFPSFHTRRNKKRCCKKCSKASLVLAHLFDHPAAGGIILIFMHANLLLKAEKQKTWTHEVRARLYCLLAASITTGALALIISRHQLVHFLVIPKSKTLYRGAAP
jgi:hypothetical protein